MNPHAASGFTHSKFQIPNSQFLILHGGRQEDHEPSAAAAALAVRRDRSAVQLDEVTDDREAETEAAVRSRGRSVGLAEAIEDERQRVGVDAGSAVDDFDSQTIAFLRR